VGSIARRTGLCTTGAAGGAGAVIVNGNGLEVPPGPEAVTWIVPGLGKRAEGTNAIASVSLGENPANGAPPQKILEFNNPLPVTTSRKLKSPATAVLGAIELIDGVPVTPEMLKTKGAEVPPPGAGLNTVIGAVVPKVNGEN
jgi:hypothetical protein